MGRSWLGVLMFFAGCSSFVGLDEPSGSETGDAIPTSSSGDAPSGTTSTTGQSGSGTFGPTGDPSVDTTSSEPDPPDPGESSGGSTDAGSTGTESSGTTGGSESTGPTVVTCEDLVLDESPPTSCSQTATAGAALSVFNDCVGTTIEVFWVDYTCSEIFYGSAAPGSAFTIGSFQTHPWRLRNALTGELMGEIPPLDGDTSISVLMR